MSSTSDLRELFEACKTGDLIKVKKLLTPQNVNEIGETQLVRLKDSNLHGQNHYFQTRLVDGPQPFISQADMEGKRSSSIFSRTVQISPQKTTEG
jgi:hypothetical protein